MRNEVRQEWIEEPIYTVNGQRMMKRYKKIKVVGEGSYSKCWLVKTENSESTYVVKIIPKKKLELLVKQKLVYEIRIHQQLSHPNVVYLDHWFEDDFFQYIFMEYCSEGNLEKEVQRSSSMSEKEIRRYARQVIEAISYIHSKNILHRDLKLCNFYLDSDKNVKLGDFGFACQLSHPGELKRETCGTPNYIAPEAVSGFGYSFSSDVWAIGVILYRLKFKLCPFEAKTVRLTLEKVKTCQYSFPKGQKISSELKDLIQKIFVINYDDRLTLSNILDHPFFDKGSPRLDRPKSESKGSFAVLRSIFSREKDPKQKDGRSNRLKESEKDKKNEVPKRSNSCQTFKQIKQILNTKSKSNFIVSQNTDMKTEENVTVMYGQCNTTGRQRSFLGGNTMRSIAETTFAKNAINKRLENTARMNNFIGNVKEQLKIQSKINQIQSKQPLSGSHQLSMIAKKYYLPSEIQFEKDVVVINYKNSIKQLIYRDNGFILHRSKYNLFDMTGHLYENPPKVLKYIIENRIQMADGEADEQEFGQNTIERILLFVAHQWIVLKDGIVLFFGTSGTFMAKMINQQLYYIGSCIKDGNSLKEDGRISLMYSKEDQIYKCAEGIVLSRIYQGWIASAFKHNTKKEE